MENVKLYCYRADGEAEVYAEFECDGDYKQMLSEAVGRRKAEGEPLADYDKIAESVLCAVVRIGRDGFKKLMRTLRHFDEVGVSNEIYDAMEEIGDDKSVSAISVGEIAEKTASLEEYEV